MLYPKSLVLFTCLVWAHFLSVFANSLRGQVSLPFYDSFSYPTGAVLAGQGSWAAASGSGTIVIREAGLTRIPLDAGMGRAVGLTPSGSAARTFLAYSARTTGTVYVSFLLRIDSLPSAQRLIGFLSSSTSSTSTPPLGLFVTAGGALAVGVKTSAPGFVSSPLAAGETHLVVVGYTFGSGGDTAQVWLNPSSLGATPSASVGSTTGGATASLGYFVWNTASASSGGGSYTVDEFRIADTFADVAPGEAADDGGGGAGDGGGATGVNLRVSEFLVEGEGLRLQGDGGRAGARYQVVAADDLGWPAELWEQVAEGEFDAEGGFVRSLPLPAAGGRRFYRVDQVSIPFFSLQPQGRTAGAGQSLSILAEAQGSRYLWYQWYKNGEPVEGQKGRSLNFTAVEASDAGDYTLVVRNAAGTRTSQVARLVVGPAPESARFYVSPSGVDSNPGSIDAPFYNLQTAVSRALPGDTIYVRGGTYAYGTTIRLERSGEPGRPIQVWAYPGERPIFDFSTQPYGPANRGMLITAAARHWHIKGLEITRSGDNGLKIEGSHIVVEQCVFHRCGDTGLQIGFGHTDINPGGQLAAFIEVINCDSYLNYDPDSKGGDADGFAAKMHCGQGIVFRGCRAWENSDDGWDLFETDYGVTLIDCWTWRSGVAQGNGNGFKLGGNGTGGDSLGTHVARRCIAFGHKVNGFTQNSHKDGLVVEHCLSFGNGTSGYNYFMEGTLNSGKSNVFRNNVSIPRSGVNGGGFINDNLAVQENNTWNLAVTANAADYVSLLEAVAGAERQPDGSLPQGFGRLVYGSDLIDRGVVVGDPFGGSAPDLGPYESAF